jgi:hypothetical protein
MIKNLIKKEEKFCLATKILLKIEERTLEKTILKIRRFKTQIFA